MVLNNGKCNGNKRKVQQRAVWILPRNLGNGVFLFGFGRGESS